MRNFRKVRELVVDFDGRSAAIIGRNGAGKTTIEDAFLYVLTGKDSSGDSVGSTIKTVNPKTGKTIPKLEHEAKLVFVDDEGDELELSKVFKEKWVTVRGNATPAMSGHTTDHYVNGVLVSERQFQDKVQAEFGTEEEIMILCEPTFFAKRLTWQKRRNYLLAAVGGVTAAEVIASNSELEPLTFLLSKVTPEDFRQQKMNQRRKLAEELKAIPARLDELDRMVPAEDDHTVHRFIEDIERDLVVATGTKDNAATLHEIEQAEIFNKRLAQQYDIQLKGALRAADNARDQLTAELNALDEQLNLKRGQVMLIKLEVYEPAVCSSCKRPLEVQVSEAEWNQARSERLESLVAEGKALRERYERMIHERSLIKPIEVPEPIFIDVDALKAKLVPTDQDPQRIEELKAELKAARDYADRQRLKEHNSTRRIELEQREETLRGEIEECDRFIFLVETFIRAKTDMLSERVNGMFRLARFVLFEEQVNGGLKEVCEIVTENGAPPSHGEGIKIGLDIIETLGRTKTRLPVFIDNCESITDLPVLEAQQIRMYVSEEKTLKVELEN